MRMPTSLMVVVSQEACLDSTFIFLQWPMGGIDLLLFLADSCGR